MNRLFGTAKPAPQAPAPAPPKEAPKVLDLSEQQKRNDAKVQELTEQINEIDKQITDQYNKSKSLKGVMATTAKQRAVLLLKKKKMYEQQLSNILNNSFALDQMAFTKENITNTMEMAQAMKQQVELQKEMFKDIDMDKLDDYMDDMEDMKYESEYMNEMMNRNYGCDVDEDELDREMAEIENDMQFQAPQQQQKQQVPAYYSVIVSLIRTLCKDSSSIHRSNDYQLQIYEPQSLDLNSSTLFQLLFQSLQDTRSQGMGYIRCRLPQQMRICFCYFLAQSGLIYCVYGVSCLG